MLEKISKFLIETKFLPYPFLKKFLNLIVTEYDFGGAVLTLIDIGSAVPIPAYIAINAANSGELYKNYSLKDEILQDVVNCGSVIHFKKGMKKVSGETLSNYLRDFEERIIIPIKYEMEVIGLIDVVAGYHLKDNVYKVIDELLPPFYPLMYQWVKSYHSQMFNNELLIVNEIYQEINSTINLERLLKLIVMHAKRLIPCDLCNIFLVNDETGELVLKVISTFDDGNMKKVKFKIGEGVAGVVFDTRKGVVIEDCESDKRFIKLNDMPEIKSMVCVPLIAQNKPIGVITITSKYRNAFDSRDYDLLNMLAATVSMAIYNTKLFERTQKKVDELSTLCSVSKTIGSSLNLEKVLNLIMKEAGAALSADIGAIMLLSDNETELIPKVSFGMSQTSHHSLRYKLGESLVGWAAQKGEGIYVKDVLADGRYMPKDSLNYEIKSDICVPLIVQDKVIGVITLAVGPQKPAFGDEDMKLLTSIATQAAVAIYNTELYEKSEQKVRELTTLYEISRAIASTLNLENVLNLAMKMINQLMNTRRCSILILDRDFKEVNVRVSQGLSEDILRGIKIDDRETVLNFVLRTKQPILIKNLEDDLFFRSVKSERYTTKSFMSVPLNIKDQVIGVINVTDKADESFFDDDDLKLLVTLANQIASDVENARLYEMAVTDGLTEIFNHKYFQQHLEKDMERAKRYQEEISLMMIDIDHFKKCNDTFGHQEGNKVLKKITSILKKSIREVDLLARYGGEEFAIVLPRTPKIGAFEIAQRIRETVENTEFVMGGQQLIITVSIGISSFPDDAALQFDLIRKSDMALYHAKKTGRNRVICYDESLSGIHTAM
ncbi:MAG TPA: sensor domain-containing diguanylate cyclase [Candidatus Wallbacteria bacterium]|nr:sensor domain-containing diguanylate cyclase [Candidatus Wallbacteria bacterium]